MHRTSMTVLLTLCQELKNFSWEQQKTSLEHAFDLWFFPSFLCLNDAQHRDLGQTACRHLTWTQQSAQHTQNNDCRSPSHLKCSWMVTLWGRRWWLLFGMAGDEYRAQWLSNNSHLLELSKTKSKTNGSATRGCTQNSCAKLSPILASTLCSSMSPER